MKHIKLFEKKNQEIWAVINVPQTGIGDVTIDLFDDQKSAENYFIVLANKIAQDDAYPKGNRYQDYIFTLEDANEFIDNSEYNVNYKKLYSNGTFDLPENLKIGKDTKKYNL